MSPTETVGLTCPLCGRSHDADESLRCHLHISHRKSEIVEAYLETVSAAASTSDTSHGAPVPAWSGPSQRSPRTATDGRFFPPPLPGPV